VERFELESTVGVGAMGTVFRAQDPSLGQAVAIMILQSHAGVQRGARLLREARALAQVNHANVVTVFEVGP
jgi:serine/threonine-protein kinase